MPYTDCSTTKGVLSLDPYVLRFDNGTSGEIYGNGGEELCSPVGIEARRLTSCERTIQL